MDTKECTKCGEVKPLEQIVKGRATCKVCKAADDKARYEKNKERILAQKKEYSARPDVRTARKEREERYKKDPVVMEARREYFRNYDKDPVRRSKKLQKERESYHSSADKKAASHARVIKRRAAKMQRKPSWANEQLIAAYYKEAKRLEELTGIQFHVDHIIPLQGELVSGLHVETNLQLLPAHENLGKSNSFDPETFCA